MGVFGLTALACLKVWALAVRVVSPFMGPPAGVSTVSRDDGVVRLEVGAVVLAGMAHVYWVGADWSLVDPVSLLGRFFSGQLRTGLSWMVAILLSVAVLMVGGRRDMRILARECRPTAIALGAFLAASVAAITAITFSPVLTRTAAAHGGFATLGALAYSFFALFCALVAFAGLVMGVRHRFRVSESARGLLPVSVLIVSFWALSTSSYHTSSGGFVDEVPVAVSLTLAFVSPLVALFWALWDLRALELTGGVFAPQVGGGS